MDIIRPFAEKPQLLIDKINDESFKVVFEPRNKTIHLKLNQRFNLIEPKLILYEHKTESTIKCYSQMHIRKKKLY